jgi:hypothetical protein
MEKSIEEFLAGMAGRGQHLPSLDHSGACREGASIPSSEFLHILKNRQILMPWIFPILCQK